MNWNDVTVFQWQQLAVLHTTETDELELNIRTAAILHNLTDNEVNAMNVEQFHKLLSSIKFIEEEMIQEPKKYLYVNGRRYRCVYDINKLPAARYIESKYYNKDVNGNLHRIMASMVIPQKRNLLGVWIDDKYDATKHEDYADDMLSAPITSVLGSVVFFCNVYLNWINLSKDYLVQQMETTMTRKEAEETYRDLWNSMVGFIKPNWFRNMNELN
jgi:hypothetical protein